MSYGKFESVEQVANIFDLEVKDTALLQDVDKFSVKIPVSTFDGIKKMLADSTSFRNEATICNKIITPILNAVVLFHRPLNVWIEEPFNVDNERGLTGEPDYLIAAKTKTGGMSIPPLCVIEAKKQDWDQGWTQALAEMVAASIKGAKVCYSIVTTGNIWAFGKLENGVFQKDPVPVSTKDLQEVFNALNQIFSFANTENVDGWGRNNDIKRVCSD